MAAVEQNRTDGASEAAGAAAALDDEAIGWFVALQDPGADPATRAGYESWRRRDARHAAAFDRIVAVAGLPELQAATLAAAGHAADARHPQGHHGGRHHGGRHQGGRRRMRPVWGGALAAALLLLVAGAHLVPELRLRWLADHRTATGGRLELSLPDGSRMTLDSASAVALDFQDERRLVRLLAGQAYFDVRRDPARPFQVAGGYSIVEVTGTGFAVRGDPGSDSVVLDHGRVIVTGRGTGGPPVELVPGEQLTAGPQGLSPAMRADPAEALAWREGRIVFHDQPFSAVVDTLRRYQPGLILVLDDALGRVPVSGNYRLDDPVAVLRAVAGIVGARVRVLPWLVVVSG